MEQSTKSKILLTALRMFALNGYEGTNLRGLAAELGLSKSALYKHYKSKDDIWDSTMEYMRGYFTEKTPLKEVNLKAPKNKEEFLSLVERVVTFSMTDENVVLGRRVLEAEMFRNDAKKGMSNNPYLREITSNFESIFSKMIENGSIKDDDPGFLALLFVSPITDMVREADREKENKGIYIEKAVDFADCFYERIKQ